MKRLLISFIALTVMLIPSFALASEPESPGDNIIREYTFVSETEDFFYNAPEQITEDGSLYFRKDIRYEVIGEEPVINVEEKTFTHEEKLTGLTKKDDGKFPDETEIDEDGFTGKIPRKAVEWTEQKREGRSTAYTGEVDLGDQVDAPTPAKEREVVYSDPSTKMDTIAVFPLKEVKKTIDYRWLSNHTATLNIRANDIISISDASPAWQGKETQLLSLMRLDPQKYIIRSAVWQGGEANGSRCVEFTMDRYAAHFVAVYEGNVKGADTVTFDGVAKYEGTLYKDILVGTEYSVKAIVTYEAPIIATPTPEPTLEPTSEPIPDIIPEPQPKPFPVAAVVVTPLLIGAAVFVFFWRKKSKANEGEE